MKANVLQKKVVAYFDFDGTLTTKDTLLPFLIHTVGYLRFILKLPIILPIVFLYLLKVIDNESAKEKVLYVLLKGKKESFIEKKAKSFAHKKIDRFIKPEIFVKFEYHQEHNHTLIIVSANLAIYLRYWAIRHRIDTVIATELEFSNDLFTGKLASHNCYGIEKVKRIEQYLKNKEQFAYSYGYGNSRGDYELLDFVDEGYFISNTTIAPWNAHGKN